MRFRFGVSYLSPAGEAGAEDFGEVLAVGGSVAGLGCWNPFRALPLERHGPDPATAPLVALGWSFWSGEVSMAVPQDHFHYGFIRFVKRSSTIETEGGDGPERQRLCRVEDAEVVDGVVFVEPSVWVSRRPPSPTFLPPIPELSQPAFVSLGKLGRVFLGGAPQGDSDAALLRSAGATVVLGWGRSAGEQRAEGWAEWGLSWEWLEREAGLASSTALLHSLLASGHGVYLLTDQSLPQAFHLVLCYAVALAGAQPTQLSFWLLTHFPGVTLHLQSVLTAVKRFKCLYGPAASHLSELSHRLQGKALKET